MSSLSKSNLPSSKPLPVFIEDRKPDMDDFSSQNMCSATVKLLGSLRVAAPAIGTVAGSLAVSSWGVVYGTAIGVLISFATNICIKIYLNSSITHNTRY